ncbi:unnamed protein product [Strongylus vulgaris]|uniref:Uncharacterized protein n=1 Tax=Strongylus vulgaris TaxID=40348 RepID=A0A3P7IFK1_STRVU|nr:unnamed protein product [Strongylus vulgaris]
MFTCPGSCGGGYQHGDEISPYPEGATSITERRTSTPSTSNVNNDGSPASSAMSPPSPAAPGTVQFEDGVPCLRRNVHAVSAETDRTTLGFELNEQRKSSEPITHRRSFLPKMNVRKSHSSDPHMTSGESKEVMETQKKRKTQSASARWEATNLELKLPPGLEKHCPSSSLADIYGDPTKAPRYGIEELLRNAHTSHIVRDFYNERRRALPTRGEPVEAAPEGRPEASGPALIRRRLDEHVHVFPLIEVDRAFKNESMPPGFKVIIITRCIHSQDPIAQEKAETALADARRVAAKHEEEKQNKHKKTINCPPANVPIVGAGPLRTATSWPKCPLQVEQSSSSSLGTSVAFPAKPEQWDHTASSSSSSVSDCADETDERVLHMSGLKVRCDAGIVFGNSTDTRENGAIAGGNSSASDSSGDLTSAMDSTCGDSQPGASPLPYPQAVGKMYLGDSDSAVTKSPRAKRPLFS